MIIYWNSGSGTSAPTVAVIYLKESVWEVDNGAMEGSAALIALRNIMP
jgi:hypothetical protein